MFLLASCNDAEQPGSESLARKEKEEASHGPQAGQVKYYYEPSMSYVGGTVLKEGHYGPPGFGKTPRIDAKDTVYVLQLDHPIDISRAVNTDPLSQYAHNVTKLQIKPHNITIPQYTGKQVQLKGLLMQDPTPASYYHELIIAQQVTVK